jgi:putative ABC transport system substrate-binding protein
LHRRRALAAIASLAAAPAFAQQPPQLRQVRRIRRVCLFFFGTPANSRTRRDAFIQAMLLGGYADGANVRYDWRYANGQQDLVNRHAREMLNAVPDVIVAFSATNAQALKEAGVASPVVMIAVDDPVRGGFAHDLSRPGTNFTGLTTNVIAQAPRYVELIDEATPRTAQIALLASPASSTYKLFRSRVEEHAARRNIRVAVLDAATPQDIERVLGPGLREVQGLVVTSDAMFYNERRRIAELAIERRIPAVYPRFGYVEAGGLMSYGPNDDYFATRAAAFVVRILDGDAPSDMPIEGPTRYELGVNRKAAAAIGLTLPEALMKRADRLVG